MKIKNKADILIDNFKKWSVHENLIKGVAIVGSYARGDFHKQSDIDLVIISNEKKNTIKQILSNFKFGSILNFKLEQWGILTALRVCYENGIEVEYGIVNTEWVNEPLDNGTLNVVTDGFRVLLDKENIFTNIDRLIKN